MKCVTLSFLLLSIYCGSLCQQKIIFTLDELVTIAQASSLRARQIIIEKRIAEYEYQFFLRNRKPSLTFTGNLPVYNKDNFGVVQPDGTILFRSRSQSNSDANFSFTQPIPVTNGQLSLNTYLNRFDDYFDKRTSYNATLFYIQLYQPVFTFNQYKWDKRIAPLKFKERQLAVSQVANEFTFLVCQLFFDVVEAQEDLELAKTNLYHAKKNHAIEVRKKELGASTDDRLLQLEMMELEAIQLTEQSESRLLTSIAELKNVVGITAPADLLLRVPENIDTAAVSFSQVFQSAQTNNPVFLSNRRMLLEAESATDQARAEGREIKIVGSFGLNKTDDRISSLYVHPNDQQRFSV
ncbi:MAG: TolC family protein, partial [Chitinophagaceae bacterium]